MNRLPIEAARLPAKAYRLKQLVLIALDSDGIQHCVTYGENRKACDEAARAGEFWKAILELKDEKKIAQLKELLESNKS